MPRKSVYKKDVATQFQPKPGEQKPRPDYNQKPLFPRPGLRPDATKPNPITKPSRPVTSPKPIPPFALPRPKPQLATNLSFLNSPGIKNQIQAVTSGNPAFNNKITTI